MKTWKTETLINRIGAARDDHERTRQWRKDSRNEAERKRLKNRIWTIRRSLNAMVAEWARRVARGIN